jgi:hypothetical protein
MSAVITTTGGPRRYKSIAASRNGPSPDDGVPRSVSYGCLPSRFAFDSLARWHISSGAPALASGVRTQGEAALRHQRHSRYQCAEIQRRWQRVQALKYRLDSGLQCPKRVFLRVSFAWF